MRANMLRKMPRFTATIAISASIRKMRKTLPSLCTFSTPRQNTSTSTAWINASTVKPIM